MNSKIAKSYARVVCQSIVSAVSSILSEYSSNDGP